jgi:hypothetical protein
VWTVLGWVVSRVELANLARPWVQWFDGSRTPVRGVRGGNTSEQDGIGGHACVRAATSWTGKRTGSAPRVWRSRACEQVCVRMKNVGGAAMMTTRIRRRAHDERTRKQNGKERPVALVMRRCRRTNSRARARVRPAKAKLWPGGGVRGHVCTGDEARRERRSRRRGTVAQ